MNPLKRRQFFAEIAADNQKTQFPGLTKANERVQKSLTSSALYASLTSLPITASETKTPVKVINLDSFDCAEKLTREGVKNIAVLNMASATEPGGWYLRGAGAQEEALCRRSTLYLTINRDFHPIPPHGGIYSPDVLVLRTSDDKGCTLLTESERWWVNVISVAGVNRPLLNVTETDYARESDRESTKERIRTILRIAVNEGERVLVLGALGAGAFRNPPRAVANCFKTVFSEDEFHGKFAAIWFAIIERGRSENYVVFKELLDGMEF